MDLSVYFESVIKSILWIQLRCKHAASQKRCFVSSPFPKSLRPPQRLLVPLVLLEVTHEGCLLLEQLCIQRLHFCISWLSFRLHFTTRF